jgi:hypothetical protein
MNKSHIAISAFALAIAAATFTAVRADEPAKKGPKEIQMPCCQIDPKAAASLDKLKALTGTWATEATDKKPTMSITFRPTSNGSAVIETMSPGTPMEMINMYTADGDTILMTHYCAMGNQPRMKLEPSTDKTMKFTFVDGGNIKTRNDAHMDSVVLTIDGDKFTEDWTSVADGKELEKAKFELHKTN